MLKKTIVINYELIDFDFKKYIRWMKLKSKSDLNISARGIMLEFCKEHIYEFADFIGEEPASYYISLYTHYCCIKDCNNEAHHRYFATWEELGLQDIYSQETNNAEEN
jgi:hypothetical protein